MYDCCHQIEPFRHQGNITELSQSFSGIEHESQLGDKITTEQAFGKTRMKPFASWSLILYPVMQK